MGIELGTVFGIGGSLLNAVGTYGSTKTNNAALKYQAALNRLNAENAELSAQAALRVGEKEQQKILTKGTHTKAAQKAGYAKSGIDLKSKTVQNVLNQTDLYTQADANTANENAVRQAGLYRVQAANYTAQANIAEHSQQNAFAAALTSGLGTALGNAAISGGLSKLADSIWQPITESTVSIGVTEPTSYSSFSFLNNAGYMTSPFGYGYNGLTNNMGYRWWGGY